MQLLKQQKSNQAFIDENNSFQALKMSIINRNLQDLQQRDQKYFPKPKDLVKPLSQQMRSDRVLTSEELVGIMDSIYSELSLNKSLSSDQRENKATELLFQWNGVINKALNDNRIPKSVLDDYNANIKANISRFVTGLPVTIPQTDEIKKQVNDQIESMLREIKKLEDIKRTTSPSVSELEKINQQIAQLTRMISNVSTLQLPLQGYKVIVRNADNLIEDIKREDRREKVIADKEDLMKNAERAVKLMTEKFIAITAELQNYNSQYMELVKNNPSAKNKRIDEILDYVDANIRNFNATRIELMKTGIPELTGQMMFILQSLGRGADALKKELGTPEDDDEDVGDDVEVLEAVSKAELEELRKKKNLTEDEKKILSKLDNKDLRFKAITELIPDKGATTFDKIVTNKEFNNLKPKKQQEPIRNAIRNWIMNNYQRNGSFKGFNPDIKHKNIAKAVAKELDELVDVGLLSGEGRRKGGVAVNLPSKTTVKYNNTKNEPESREITLSKQKKTLDKYKKDSVIERNFTKIKF
jgi:hypothetical protein